MIELLVVIAIIGILSSVVLASLNTARSKSADTAIKANLATLRVQSEFYYDSNGNSYGTMASSTIGLTGLCGTPAGLFTDVTIQNALKAAMNQKGNGNAYCGANNATGIGSGGGWSVSVPLKTNPSISWCVGNIGKAGTTTTPVSAASFTGC